MKGAQHSAVTVATAQTIATNNDGFSRLAVSETTPPAAFMNACVACHGSRSSEAVGSASTAASCVAIPHTSSAKSVGLNRSILSCAALVTSPSSRRVDAEEVIGDADADDEEDDDEDGGVYGAAQAA